MQSFRNAPKDNCELLDDEIWRFWEGKADDTEIIPHETLVTTSRKRMDQCGTETKLSTNKSFYMTFQHSTPLIFPISPLKNL